MENKIYQKPTLSPTPSPLENNNLTNQVKEHNSTIEQFSQFPCYTPSSHNINNFESYQPLLPQNLQLPFGSHNNHSLMLSSDKHRISDSSITNNNIQANVASAPPSDSEKIYTHYQNNLNFPSPLHYSSNLVSASSVAPTTISSHQIPSNYQVLSSQSPQSTQCSIHSASPSLNIPLYPVQSAYPSFTNSSYYHTPGFDDIDLRQHNPTFTLDDTSSLPSFPSEFLSKNPPRTFIRPTLSCVPPTKAMLQKSQLHFGLHASPFRTDRSIPLLSCEIDRCKDCRAYINMFVAVSEGGRRWRCNMCQAENTLSESNNLMNPSGSYQHCVPQQSIVEFTATKQYLVRETPQPAVHLFLIDVSAHSVSSGMLATTVNVIKDHLFAIPGGCNKRLAFITFNDTIHFYNLKNDSGHPKIQIVPEISDAFVPSYEGFLVSLEESEEVIAELLESLPALYRETNITKSCMGAALKVACELMQLSGGRIMLFLSCLPNAGEPVLLDREAAVEKSTKEGPSYFLPASDFFTVFPSEVCSKFQIGMDLFLFTSQYIDVASLSNLARYSGGTCYYYRGFDVNNFPEMTEKYKNELSNVLCREMALEAVFRMRCSKGLSIENYCGNFFRRSFDLLVIPYANPDFSYSMDVHVDDDLSRLSSVAFQSAFLYTTATGERRIRVCTLCLPVAKTIGDLFRFADSDSMICFLAKIACEKVLEAKISSVREAFFSKVRHILAAYSQGVRGLPKGQYVLPMALSNFALCTLALMKSVCFDLRTAYKLDDISYYLHLFRIFPVPQLIMSIRPCLFALHYLLEAEHIFQPLPLTFRSIEEAGIYLLFNGFEIIVFVLEKVPAILLQQLFGARDFASLSSSYHSKFSCTFPILENLISQKARALVSYLQGMFPSIFPLFFLVKSTDSNFRSFVSKNFIMDKTETNPSYAEFIDLLYK